MRIYRREAFMRLPAGVLYCKGKPWYFESLMVKGETLDADFQSRCLCWIEASSDGEQFARLEAMLEHGVSFPMEDAYGRDGCFDSEDLFLVFERADLAELQRVLDAAVSACNIVEAALPSPPATDEREK